MSVATRAFWMVLLSMTGCSADRARASEVYVPAAPPQQDPAPSPPPSDTQPAAPQSTPQNACVMLYECGCNAGCTEIDQPRASLHEGMSVRVLSGSLAGSSVFVARSLSHGKPIFTVQRADPHAPIMLCATTGPLLGYLCSVKDSGEARECRSCPNEAS